jgi:hypothetical protein
MYTVAIESIKRPLLAEIGHWEIEWRVSALPQYQTLRC